MANERHSNNFDAIRLLASILVIITHSYVFTNGKGSDALSTLTNGLLAFSYIGVAVFFTISGYLITQSALSSKTWSSYLWKRFLRIIPGLAVVILLSAFILGPVITSVTLNEYFRSTELYQYLLSVTMYIQKYALPGVFKNNHITIVNGSLWTLAYEFTLYIAVIVACYIGILKQKRLLIVIWLLMLIIRIYLGDHYFVYNYVKPYLLNLNIMYLFEWSFYFLSGMIVFLYKDVHIPNLKITVILISIYIIVIASGLTDVSRILNYIVIPYSLFCFSFIPSKLSNLNKVGDFSYGMYIYAFPVQQTLIYAFNNSIPVVWFILLSIALTLPFAVASWHLIEKRALSFKNVMP